MQCIVCMYLYCTIFVFAHNCVQSIACMYLLVTVCCCSSTKEIIALTEYCELNHKSSKNHQYHLQLLL